MSDLHFKVWPAALPRHLSLPETSVFYNLKVSARRYPRRAAIVFYETSISYARLHAEALALAGYLQGRCQVAHGDRVMLFMQNSPQFIAGYYAVLRADAAVVPVNPMNRTDELRHYCVDSGATVAMVAQELFDQVAPLLAEGLLKQVIVVTYSDYLEAETELRVPDVIRAPRQTASGSGVIAWLDALAAAGPLAESMVGPDDLCVMPYTSGTTGQPKGCMHTHRSVMHTAVAGIQWFGTNQDHVILSVLPYFHVTGMQTSMNGPIFSGNTIVLLPRWDREVAGHLVERYRVSGWTSIPTMVVDFLSNPQVTRFDLSSIFRMSGGGAAMPEAIAQKLRDLCGITYVEGYGLSETIGPSHINPPDRPQKQCLGIPIFDTESRVVDPATLAELPQGEVGEIITSGPQVMMGYWNQPEATRAALVEIDGKRFLRTGDLGRIDEHGYFFLVDRLKRMINASGFKVWPAEVEAMLFGHPAVQEACVIAARDAHRGETVKAVIVLKESHRGLTDADAIIAWSRERMAAYKIPRVVEFVETLPKSGTGKVQWRMLQEQERDRSAPCREA